MKEITEDYVSFETAKLLKEKGFDGRCDYEYGFPAGIEQGAILQKWRISHDGRVQNSELIDDACSAPTLQMAMKWLREEKRYYIQVMLDSWACGGHLGYYVVIQKTDSDFEMMLQDAVDEVFYQTYEDACEAAIKYCLENLI